MDIAAHRTHARIRRPGAKARSPRAPKSLLEDLLAPRDALESVRLVRAGIPAGVVDAAVARFGLSKERFVKVLHTSKPTLNRLKREKRPLDPLLSGAFKEAAEVLEKLRTAVGEDPAAMADWLNGHVPALGGKPIDLLDTPDGRNLVSATLDRARYGVFG